MVQKLREQAEATRTKTTTTTTTTTPTTTTTTTKKPTTTTKSLGLDRPLNMAEILASLSGNDISMADSALRLGQGKILHIDRFLLILRPTV